MAVAATATGRGKKRAKAGMSMVPRPKPEKKVSPETKRATRDMIRYCIGAPVYFCI